MRLNLIVCFEACYNFRNRKVWRDPGIQTQTVRRGIFYQRKGNWSKVERYFFLECVVVNVYPFLSLSPNFYVNHI